MPAREVQDGVGLVAGAYHHALAGAMLDLAIVDHAYALGAAGQGLVRHIEEIGQPGQAGGKRVGDLRSAHLAPTRAVERCPRMSLAQAREPSPGCSLVPYRAYGSDL